MTKRIAILLAEGFEEIEAVTPVDVFRRAGLDVTLVGLGARSVRGAHRVTYQCDATLDELKGVPDAVVLPGGLPGAENLGKSPAVERLVRQVYDAGGICAAICAAPAYTFAAYGLLDGRKATCYPSFETRFGPTTQASKERVVVDGRIVTSRGPGTALEFSLRLVEMLCDKKTAQGPREGMLAKA